MAKLPKWFWAEVLGTFLLVFFGCGAVATAVALEALTGLFQVAIVWGLGLTVAITLTGGISGAHLNPAITIAFAVASDFPARRIAPYVLAQFIGAFIAATTVYFLFSGPIMDYEASLGVVRGEAGSEATAMIFGDYFPNPSGKPIEFGSGVGVSTVTGFLAEFLGTALLALSIFGFINPANPNNTGRWTPLAIGLTLTTLICVFAPLTMAGFNPARDLAPRVFSSLAGWGTLPFAVNSWGWLWVYLVAPCLGAVCGAWTAVWFFGEEKKTAIEVE